MAWNDKIFHSILDNDGRNVIATVTQVARNGMARYIKFAVIVDGELQPLTWQIAQALDKKEKPQGIYISGCGMDMIFDTLYKFYRVAYDIPSQDALKLAGHYQTF